MHDLCIHTTYVYHISYIIYHMHICTQDYTKHVLCSFLFRPKTPRYWCAGNFGLTPHRWWTSLADKPWLELSMIIKRSMINICYLVGLSFVNWVILSWFLTTFAFTMPILEKAVCPQTSGHPTGTFPSPHSKWQPSNMLKILFNKIMSWVQETNISNHPTLEAFILLK